MSTDAKADAATRAAAHTVVNYRTQDVAAVVAEVAPGGVDAVIEVDLGANADLDASIAAAGAGIAVYDLGDRPLTGIPQQSMMKNHHYDFVMTYAAPAPAKDAAVAGVTAALAAGALSVGDDDGLPTTTYPLDAIRGAHAAVEAGRVGKVLIAVRS